MSVLNKSYFHNEPAALARLESILWPGGPTCPHCGNVGKVYDLKGVRSKPTKKHPNGVERHGLKKCAECRKQFTVRVGTIFEDSHAPLHKWFQAIHLMCASKKGVSAHQLHRMLEVQYKTAWFMAHRIREAMRSGPLAPMAGPGGIVEFDETVIGKRDAIPSRQASYTRDRNIVLTLVNRRVRRGDQGERPPSIRMRT
jgi:transposase-like protein